MKTNLVAAWLMGLIAALHAAPAVPDNPSPPPIMYSSTVPQSTVPESAGAALFVINASEDSTRIRSVSWSLGDGTATPGEDFLPPFSGIVVFESGQTSTNIWIPIVNDSIPEPSETLTLKLGNPVGGVLDANPNATVTIIDDDFIPPPASADLELQKEASAAEVEQGDPVVFTLTLLNKGPDPATGVVVRDAMPSAFQFLSAEENGLPAAFDPGSGNWSVGSIAVNETRTLILHTSAIASGVWTNRAEVTASSAIDPDSAPDNDDPTEDDLDEVFVSVLLPTRADLQLLKFADPATAGAGQTITFVVRLGNAGPDDSKDIVVKDTLPAGLTLKEAKPPDGTTFDRQKMEWKVPALAAGRFLDLELLTTVNRALRVTNVAEITAFGVRDPDRSNNRAQVPAEWVLYSACGAVKFCRPINGDPHTNAIVELYQNGQRIAMTRSDDQGAFCFTNLNAGAYRVIAKPADPKSGIKDSEGDDIEFGADKAGGVLQIVSPWPVVRGRITYPQGGPPVPDIDVRLAGNGVNKTVKTDAGGAFQFNDVADGDYTVTPVRPNPGDRFNPPSARIKADICVTTTNFVYYGDRIVQGRVITCDKPPVPVPFAVVTLTADGGPVVRTLTTAADGAYRFTNLVAGKYTVDATHPGYDIDSVDVDTTRQNRTATLTGSPKRGIITARVVDAQGAPVSGQNVDIFPPNAARPTATIRTDANGWAIFPNVAAGNWVVRPQSTDPKITFRPPFDGLVIGNANICRNHAVFTSSASAVELVAIEVVQVIQDWRNSMPLVEGKQTLVRVFFKPAGTNRTPVTMQGVQLKVELAGGAATTIRANRSVVARADFAPVRNGVQTSLPFDITRQARGEVTLTVEWPNGFLTTSPDAVAAGAAQNNSTKVKFVAPPPLDIKWVLLSWEFERKKDAATAAMIAFHRTRLLAGLPVTTIGSGTNAQKTITWKPDYDPTDANRDTEFKNTLALLDLLADDRARNEPRGSKAIYYTLVKGLPLRDNSPIGGNLVLVATPLNAALYRNRPTHELGHALGRHHAVHSAYGITFGDGGPTKNGACDEIAAINAPDFPMQFLNVQPLQPTLGPMRLGDYRFAYGWDHSDGVYISPYGTADLMSYCSFTTPWTWPGLYTYTNLYNALVNRFGRGGAPAPTVPATDEPCLLISGHVGADGSAATLNPVDESLYPRTPELPPPGDYTLRLLDPQGVELFSAPFAPQFVFDADPAPILAPEGSFLFCLPRIEPLGAVEVRHGGQLLARRTASAHAPFIQIAEPVAGATIDGSELALRWVAGDMDGDPMSFAVDISFDAGVNWSSLAHEITGLELTLPADELRGSANARLRVTANDGMHRTRAEIPVSIADRPPIVEVESPEADAVLTGDAPIVLRAFASDREDGDLEGASVHWSSEADGALGEGTELTIEASDLTEGRQRITVTATDSAGQPASQTVVVQVTHSVGPQLRIALVEDELEVSCPAEADLAQLQASLSLLPDFWFPVAGEWEVIGDQRVMHLPLLDEEIFFRLTEP